MVWPCALLLAGATANTSVAWAFAVWGRHGVERDIDPKEVGSWPPWSPPTWPTWTNVCSRKDGLFAGLRRANGPGMQVTWQTAWLSAFINPVRQTNKPTDRIRWIGVEMTETGWPFHGLRCDRITARPLDSQAPLVRTYLPTRWRGLQISYATALPIQPIWPGFLLNTLFYAALIAAPRPAFLWLRSRRRLRRGLCPRCAYDLRGLASAACPECGHGVG